MIPLERVSETFADVFAHPLAEGAILEADQVVAARAQGDLLTLQIALTWVAGVNQAIKQHLTG